MGLRASRPYQAVVAPLRFALDKTQIFDPLYWASRAFPNSKIVSFLRRIDNAMYKFMFGDGQMKYPSKAMFTPKAQQHAVHERQKQRARGNEVSQTPAIDAALERRDKILAKAQPTDRDAFELQWIDAGFAAVRSVLDSDSARGPVEANAVFKNAYREAAGQIARQQDTTPTLRAERAQATSKEHVLG